MKVILENPAYTGDYVAGRYTYGKFNRLGREKVEKGSARGRRPKEKWVVIPDRHDSIIDRGLFERAQTKRA